MSSRNELPRSNHLTRFGLAVALLVIAALYVPRLIAIFPLEHDVTLSTSEGDDWWTYHRNAVSVLRRGLTMPSVTGAYVSPAGFGYTYFVALVYAGFGVRSEAVYLIQALLLIASIVGMFAVFRSDLSTEASLAFLIVCAVYMYLDVYRLFTFRLLSENVLFPLFPLLLYLVWKGESSGRPTVMGSAGVVCGLCFLMRPNLVLFGPVTATVIVACSRRPMAWRVRAASVFLVAFAITFALMPARNYAVTGQFRVPALTNFSDWSTVRNLIADPPIAPEATAVTPQFLVRVPTPEPAQPSSSSAAKAPETSAPDRGPTGPIARVVSYFVTRLAFLIGIPQFVQPTFRPRPHWMVMWALVGWYVVQLVHRRPAFLEVLAMSLAVGYLGPLIVTGNISSYGTRMVAPVIPLLVLLAVKGLDVSRSTRVSG